MDESLRNLSSHLSKASNIISSMLDKSTSQASTSVTPAPASNVALNRARAMLNSSISRGNFTRMNKRERLRAQASDSDKTSAKKKKESVEKTFEFVLVDVSKLEEENWAISNEIIVLRGLIDISTESKECEIRKEIGDAIRMKFPAVNDGDFEFLRATRRKLSKPVNCKGYDYKQLKVVAGQGAIYIKAKDGLECLLGPLDDQELEAEKEQGN